MIVASVMLDPATNRIDYTFNNTMIHFKYDGSMVDKKTPFHMVLTPLMHNGKNYLSLIQEIDVNLCSHQGELSSWEVSVLSHNVTADDVMVPVDDMNDYRVTTNSIGSGHYDFETCD